MGKISYPQLVKNIADAYRSATNTSEPIAIGNLVYKVTEAISSSHDYFIYKSIVYNEDNTITLIDNEDVEHTVSCIYEDDAIVAITLDNKIINLNYNDDNLVSVEGTTTNLNNAPKTSQLIIQGKSSINVVYPVYGEIIATPVINTNDTTILVSLECEE